MKQMRSVSMIFAAICLVLPALSHAGIVYTSGASDGVAAYQTWMGGNDKWASTGDNMMGGCNYFYGGSDRYRANPVMMFSLSSFAGTQDITAALGFYVTSGENLSKGYVRFYDAVVDGTVSYNSGNGGSKVTGSDLTTTGWYSIDVSSQVQTALDKGYQWVTFNINMSTYDMSATVVASEGATGIYAGLGPQLSIVPEPATLILLAAGMLAFRKTKK